MLCILIIKSFKKCPHRKCFRIPLRHGPVGWRQLASVQSVPIDYYSFMIQSSLSRVTFWPGSRDWVNWTIPIFNFRPSFVTLACISPPEGMQNIYRLTGVTISKRFCFYPCGRLFEYVCTKERQNSIKLSIHTAKSIGWLWLVYQTRQWRLEFVEYTKKIKDFFKSAFGCSRHQFHKIS